MSFGNSDALGRPHRSVPALEFMACRTILIVLFATVLGCASKPHWQAPSASVRPAPANAALAPGQQIRIYIVWEAPCPDSFDYPVIDERGSVLLMWGRPVHVQVTGLEPNEAGRKIRSAILGLNIPDWRPQSVSVVRF